MLLDFILVQFSLISFFYVSITKIFYYRIVFLFQSYSKGISQSALPYRRTVPNWLKLSAEDVKEQIYKLSKKGLSPSQIGK